MNLNSAFNLKNNCSNCNKNLKKSLTLDYWIIVFVFGSGILSSFWNFDFITIILWIFEFKQKIDQTVRSDKIEQRNYFEKLLNKQDPVKMNLSTVTTNPISNNRELNQSKTATDSNAHKLFQQKKLEKIRAKENKNKIKKPCEFSENNTIELMEINTAKQQQQQCLPVFNQFNNHLNMFNQNQKMFNANGFLSNELNHNEFNTNNLSNGLVNNLPNTLPNQMLSMPSNLLANDNLETNSLPLINQTGAADKPNYENNNNIAKLNELKRKENEFSNVFITHGMSDQNKVSDKLINPFEEKRRPDSKLELNHTQQNQLNENLKMTNLASKDDHLNSLSIQNANLIQSNLNNNLNNINYQMPFNQFTPANHPLMYNSSNLLSNFPQTNFQPPPPQSLNSILPFYPQATANPLMNHQYANNYLPQFYHLFLLNQQYTNAQYCTTSKNMNDVEARKREISETVHITQTVNSESEANDSFLPIQISESDASSVNSLDIGDRLHVDKIKSDFKDVIERMDQCKEKSEFKKKNGI